MQNKPTGLRRQIILALLFKLCALVLLYMLFFGPSHRFKPTSTQMADHFSNAWR